jgi:hypothetical protein
VTSQEPHTQHIADPDVPDTEVIPVEQPAPVFVDSTGRRRRLLRRFAYGFGAFCMVYGGLISLSLAGGPVSPSAALPFPQFIAGGEPPAGQPRPTPEPIMTAPKSVLVNDATPRRGGAAGSWDGDTVTTNQATAQPTRAAAPTMQPTATRAPSKPLENTPSPVKTPTNPPSASASPTGSPSPSDTVDSTGGTGTGGTGGGAVSDGPDEGGLDEGGPDPVAADPGDGTGDDCPDDATTGYRPDGAYRPEPATWADPATSVNLQAAAEPEESDDPAPGEDAGEPSDDPEDAP